REGRSAIPASGPAQPAEEPAGIGQRAPPGRRHAAHHLGGPLRRLGRRRDRRVAQGDHDREVMGDYVVHLPGHPGALGGGGDATVYRATSRAAPAMRWLFHSAAPMEVVMTQPNTWTGQIRRTSSGATIRASTTKAAGPGR